jgi:hypothetical protein
MSSGNWDNGVYAGARTVNTNNVPWNVNTNIGVRLACDNFSLLYFEGVKNVCEITVSRTVAIP